MSQLLAGLGRLLRRNLLLFALIVLILASGSWVSNQWRQGQVLINQLPALRAAQQDVDVLHASLDSVLTQQGRQLASATVERLDSHIATLDRELQQIERRQQPVSVATTVFGVGAPLTEQLRRQALLGVELEMRRQFRAHLLELRMHAQLMGNRQAAQARLEQLRQAHVQVYGQLRSSTLELEQLRAAAGWFAVVPGTPSYRQAARLQARIGSLRAANARAYQAYRTQRARLERLALPAALSPFRVTPAQSAEAVALLHRQIQQAEALAAHNLVWRAYQATRPVLPTALAILVAWWLLPAALRTLFYFVLAPLAARRPPVIIAAHSAAPAYRPFGSAVSLALVLAPDEDLVCRPDYCQSQPLEVKVTTRVLFDWRHALTSMAAQLWMLKLLRSSQRSQLVLSSTRDPLDELAIVDIGAGAAFVLHPRALVGMVHARGQRPVIRSHWRLGTLHAWLTLQLRYLVFEGPVRLVVRGCRGVRMESAAPTRVISQDATLGFSANARYGTVRAEPFLAYLRGAQPLLHDCFAGQAACFLYEEVPRRRRSEAQQSNPLSMLVETGMRAFGI
ncbi:hypothetical protein KY495_05510 [Massilia sp. PAMC28688]|uniref:hypothetical protein n=1 Tax=Massilia sp. PAMC28688 TaxID=2861283 RepID=UPI001C6360A5|nr:hypothetical protein [Massilia sp. PAMC28688]QYF94654.1 hypothetical protein KY495_05510 [Massilia sp. PAMC28688]